MSTPGYPYMDGPQQMYKPDPNESSAPMQDVTIQTSMPDMAATQQGLRDALRATYPMPVDPDGDND